MICGDNNMCLGEVSIITAQLYSAKPEMSFVHVQKLRAAFGRFVMVRIFDNDPGGK